MRIEKADADQLVSTILNMPGDASIAQFEQHLQNVIETAIPREAIRSTLDRRAFLVASQVARHLVGETVVDIGCGDGMVSWYLEPEGKQMKMLDVQNYVDSRVQLPFKAFVEGEPLPVDGLVDTTLLLTVLHHAKDPIGLLRATRDITRSRLIVIESVYGVHQADDFGVSPLAHLDDEQQFKYASFVDWLYNRVIHRGVAVPCNFARPVEWPAIFSATGWRIRKTIPLGIDQPVVPEYHFLYVLDPVLRATEGAP